MAKMLTPIIVEAAPNKMASLKLKKKNGKDSTKKSAIKKTSNIAFDDDDDDYIEDNQFSQQHYW
jgi:hypothetical protein